MSHRIIVRPEAQGDLRLAYRWYEAQRQGLGDEFLLCVDACMAGILRHPRLAPVAHRDARRALLRRFPYGVFYVVGEEAISVIAVMDLRRSPRLLEERLG
ncbi:MAG TPA: type II toxin-antitoxin system RelE/ParE family toxin [Planctomycetota bacterium]|nr:type II toxin-antitoxin system RelE/ParE family toxin [Planctomycetota bacterium]